MMPAPDYSHSWPKSHVTSGKFESAPEQRASPLGSERYRANVSRRQSRGVSDTGQLWLVSLAAVPTWLRGKSWTGQLPPAATRTYLVGFRTSSMAWALRCVAVVLDKIKGRLIHRFCLLSFVKLFFQINLIKWEIYLRQTVLTIEQTIFWVLKRMSSVHLLDAGNLSV